MRRALILVYGIAAYATAMTTLAYAMGFVANLIVPVSMDVGPASRWQEALPIDAALLALFAVQHSVMARRGFKPWWTRIVPKPIERSTYALFASAALALLFWQWRPIGDVVWTIQQPSLRHFVQALSWVGWWLVVVSSFLLNHFELFGVKQAVAAARGGELRESEFTAPGLYKLVRHPIYLGFLIAFWSTPDMTAGHLLFSVVTTAYILIGIAFEERDLVALFGDAYRKYRHEVPMLLPWPKRPAAGDDEGPHLIRSSAHTIDGEFRQL